MTEETKDPRKRSVNDFRHENKELRAEIDKVYSEIDALRRDKFLHYTSILLAGMITRGGDPIDKLSQAMGLATQMIEFAGGKKK